MEVKGHEDLQKDPISGAVILAPKLTKESIIRDNLVKKVSALYEQNKQIMSKLNEIASLLSNHINNNIQKD